MKLNDKNTATFKTDPDTGFLVTTAKLARIGAMQYLGEELGRTAGKVYDVVVEEKDLFNSETIKSFDGAAVTIEHPEEMAVNASNWKELAVGHISNVRREGEFLVGDVIVNDSSAIRIVQSGKNEVSCGYDADLIDANDGTIKKQNIKGNHLAIVSEGRCGVDCKLSLNDGKPKMKKKSTITDSLRKAFGLNKPKAKAVKFGDAKRSLKAKAKKLNDAKADFDAKLKDAEEVIANPDAPVEEKAAAVQELQAEASNLMEEATAAIDEATAATEQAEEIAAQIEEEAPADGTITDEDVAGVAAEADDRIAALETENQELKDKIKELEEQLATEKEKEEQAVTANDARRVFPKVVIKDSMSSVDIKRAVVVSTGAYDTKSVRTLTDCALNSAYAAALTVGAKTSNVGKKFLANDSKPTERKLPASLRKGAK